MPNYNILFKDIFTPTTIKRYTHHFDGTVYGSIDKSRNGKTHINGTYICGTDQGFLGIVGSMLSGISMARSPYPFSFNFRSLCVKFENTVIESMALLSFRQRSHIK